MRPAVRCRSSQTNKRTAPTTADLANPAGVASPIGSEGGFRVTLSLGDAHRSRRRRALRGGMASVSSLESGLLGAVSGVGSLWTSRHGAVRDVGWAGLDPLAGVRAVSGGPYVRRQSSQCIPVSPLSSALFLPTVVVVRPIPDRPLPPLRTAKMGRLGTSAVAPAFGIASVRAHSQPTVELRLRGTYSYASTASGRTEGPATIDRQAGRRAGR